jgi:hypothetical protein
LSLQALGNKDIQDTIGVDAAQPSSDQAIESGEGSHDAIAAVACRSSAAIAYSGHDVTEPTPDSIVSKWESD